MNALTTHDITSVEIEVASTCNLRCPLCLSQNDAYKKCISHHEQTLEEWKAQLGQFTNLETISIAGFSSEPTLYRELIPLVDYIKSRGLKIELYTNGNTHSCSWWSELANHLSTNDRVIFTVCGSTQELHSKYRVGSDLNTLLSNIRAFRTDKQNEYVRIIRFEYNKNDICNAIKLALEFSHCEVIDSEPFAERFGLNASDDVHMRHKLSLAYNFIKSQIERCGIECRSFRDKFVNISSDGKIYPCFLHKMACIGDFNNLNYDSILAGKYEFCFECDRAVRSKLDKFGIEEMV